MGKHNKGSSSLSSHYQFYLNHDQTLYFTGD